MAQLATLNELSDRERDMVRDDSELQDQLLGIWRSAFIGQTLEESRTYTNAGITIIGGRYPCSYVANPLAWDCGRNPPKEFRMDQAGNTECCKPILVGVYPDSTGTLMCRIRRDWRPCDVFAPRIGPPTVADQSHVRITGPAALNALRNGDYLSYNEYEGDDQYDTWRQSGLTLTCSPLKDRKSVV